MPLQLILTKYHNNQCSELLTHLLILYNYTIIILINNLIPGQNAHCTQHGNSCPMRDTQNLPNPSGKEINLQISRFSLALVPLVTQSPHQFLHFYV